MTTITVNNVWSRLSGLKDIQVADNLDKLLSFYVEGYQYTRAFTQGYFKDGRFVHWDGKKHLLTQKMVFPTGLLTKVKDFLERKSIEVIIDDQRSVVKSGTELPICNFEPREYQQEAVDAAITSGTGMIRIGTGGGKSAICIMISARYNIPTMIYVVGKDLLYQFHKTAEKLLNQKIGIIGDGKCEIQKINICSIWTAITAFDVKSNVSLDDEDWAPEIIAVSNQQKKLIKSAVENANLAIFDEAHFLATDTIQSIFKAGKKCRYIYGFSGTDWRDDGADLLLESVCGPRIYNLPSSKLIENNFLVPPKIVFYNVPELEERLASNYLSVYSKYIVKNDVRNEMIIDVVRKLIEKNRKILILVRQIAHGKKLAEMLSDIPLFFVNGEVDGETRQEVKQAFEDGTYKCLIASSVFDIGVDIPCLDALVLAGGGKSSVRALQRIGRVLRPYKEKKDAFVIDFLDNAKYLEKHSALRVAIYQTEPNFKIKLPEDFDSDRLKKIKLKWA